MRYALDGLTATNLRRHVRSAVHVLRSAYDNSLSADVIAVRKGNVRQCLETYWYATRGRQLKFKDYIE